MTKTEQVQLMTEKMAKFVAIVGKKLPDDVEAKLDELREKETTTGTSLECPRLCGAAM